MDFPFIKSCELQVTLRIRAGEPAGYKLFLGDRKRATPDLNVSDWGAWVDSGCLGPLGVPGSTPVTVSTRDAWLHSGCLGPLRVTGPTRGAWVHSG